MSPDTDEVSWGECGAGSPWFGVIASIHQTGALLSQDVTRGNYVEFLGRLKNKFSPDHRTACLDKIEQKITFWTIFHI